ncbi:killer cell lectin-like receptor subfamily F member 1 isoform X2 [Ornithorhynchus anatinus]|uniref:killer cell lectin-like receptor subfamily F member 1 isoform X2 n=1 Tax=Ornithorhynchus anatinus TaxID=9258 RepID=UPI0019D4A4C7|nr:killer cell lectin-like receptor subfamily F member 1 isoform X2 [Ornithorhynchus anatinus]
MDVQIVPKGKRRRPSPKQQILYATLRVPHKPDTSILPSAPPPGLRPQDHVWRVASVSLGIALVMLLVSTLCLYLKTSEGSNCENDWVPKVSCEDDLGNESSARLAALKKELCIGQQGAMCELCPPGWWLNSSRCYFFSGERRSWEASAKDCADRKSRLLVLEDEAEAVEVPRMGPRDEYFWIGYKYNMTQRTWTWLDNAGFSGYRLHPDIHFRPEITPGLSPTISLNERWKDSGVKLAQNQKTSGVVTSWGMTHPASTARYRRFPMRNSD